MKIGDKVRFLYDIGGGIVRGFKNKDIVIVEDETGFEIPMLVKECLVVSDDKDMQVSKQSQKKEDISKKHIFTNSSDDHESNYIFDETKEGECISLYLVFLSNDLKTLGTSSYDIYLINESNFFLNYTFLNQDEHGWLLRKEGVIEPNTKIFIEEIESRQVNILEHICLQAVAYKKNKPFTLKSALTKEMRLDLSKLFKVHCFKSNKFFDEPAIIFTLIMNDAQNEFEIDKQSLKNAFSKNQYKSISGKTENGNNATKENKKKEKKKIIEIDLHINELLDNIKGMTNAQILEYQLDTFNRVMHEHKQNKGQKIVFIHGKGEGVLRKSILDELKKKFKKAEVQDASFREYGFGATMVTIH